MTNYITSVGVQHFSITINSGSTTGTATISAVGAGSFIILGGINPSIASHAGEDLARLSISGTTITATRNTSTAGTVVVTGCIIDGDTTNLIKSVQYGTVSVAGSSASGTATISAVTNNNTALHFLGTSDAAGSPPGFISANSFFRVGLSGTTVTATRATTGAAAVTVGFVAIEFQGAALNQAVQNVSASSSSNVASWTATITSVTTGNAILINGGATDSSTAGINPANSILRGSLSSATQVTVNVNTATTNTRIWNGTVVEFIGGLLNSSVQRGTITITAGTSNTATITSVTKGNSGINHLGNTSTATSNINASESQDVLTNGTTVTASLSTSGTITDSWEVFEFPAFSSGIALDAASNSGYQTAQSTYSWNHTVTGSNTYLVVGIGMLSVVGSSVSGITFNGISMDFLGAKASVSGAVRAELWGQVAPSSGTHSIAVTLSAALDSGGGAVSYTGVNQSSSTEALNTASATNVGAADATVTVTTVADNDWVVDITASDDTAITIGAGNTSRSNVTGTLGSAAVGDTNAAKTPAGSQVMSWTSVGALATWSIAAIAIRPVAAANLASKVFRKTLSGIGTRVGVRQLQGW